MSRASRGVCGALLCLLAVGGLAVSARAAGEPPLVPDELLVRFRARAKSADAAEAHHALGATVKKGFKKFDRLQLVKLPPGLSVKEAARRYRENPDVLYAEPNYLLRALAVPNDPQFPSLWGLQNTGQDGGAAGADIDAPQAWNHTTGSASVVVTVIDTGVDYNHPDLEANIYSNPADCDADGVDDDGNGWADDCHGIDTANGDADPMDDHDHGTHCAGTIGAVGDNGIGVAGVNWSVSIMACKFLAAEGWGTTDGAIACLDYVAAMKDAGVNIVATSNSWGGGGYSQALADAIDAQRARGILFIAAAGNSARDTDEEPNYPSGYDLPNIISVAATDRDDQRAWFSNYGRRSVDLGAPGSEILSTVTVANGSYDTFSGTSMATPHVTGVAALLKAQDPARDWRAIRNLLLSGGDVVPAMASTVTGRRLNAAGALTCAGRTISSRLEPEQGVAYGSVGGPIGLAVLNITCDTPAGEVTVAVDPPGPGATLLDDGAAPDRFAGDGIYAGSWTPPAAGVYTLTFPGGDTVRVEVYDLGEALDRPGETFTTSGGGWYGQTTASHDGVDAAASGRIGNGQSASLETTVDMASPSYATFWWRVSSEQGWDFLEFAVDGVVQAAISGEVPWQERAFALDAGTHTLTWTYRKDESVRVGADTAWVDQLAFTATPPERTLTVTSANPADGVAIAAGPADLDGAMEGLTPFTRRHVVGTEITLTAPALVGLNYFVRWEGCTTAAGRTCLVGLDTSRTASAVYGTGAELAQALDQPDWTFTTEGNAAWYGQTALSHDGVDAARPGVIANAETALLETTRVVPEAGYLSFWWKVSSEQGYDFLEFAVDGAVQASISGEVDWQRKVFPVSAGTHTFTWTYRKDAIIARGSDTGWVDDVAYGVDLPTQTLYVATANLPGGAAITVTPADRNGATGGTTPFARVYDWGSAVTLQAPLSEGENSFVGWTGCTSAAGNTCSVILEGDRTVTAAYSSGESLAEAVDRPDWVVTSQGDAFWWNQAAVTHDGVDAAQAGAIGHSQSTRMETTRTFAADGYLTFWWKVSSEQGFDYLRLGIDGVVKASISGAVDWERKVFAVPAGTHTFTWTYSKDGSVVSGADTGWVDEVAFGPDAPPQVLTVSSVNPPGGVPIAVSPADRNAEGDGTTPFTRTYGYGTTVTLEAPALEGENGFIGWSGCTGAAGAVCTVTMDADRAVTAVFASGTDLGEAVDRPDWVFTSGGDFPWLTQTAETHDGIDAAQAGPVAHYGDTWMKTTQTLAADGYLTFWWKVSSEQGRDVLEFSVDGTAVASLSGEAGWERRVVPLEAGTHTLTWTYSKNGSVSRGLDSAWVDEVNFSATAPTMTLSVASADPAAGVAIAVTPADRNGDAGGTTPFARAYGYGASVTLTAPEQAGESHLIGWEGCSSVSGRSCTVTVDADRTATAVYGAGASLGDAIDRPTWVISSGGDAIWHGQTAVTHDGIDAAQAGVIAHEQSTWMEATRTFSTDGYLTFWWKVSSEAGYDYLEFSVDGVRRSSISGERDWERRVVSLTAGTHTLTWTYRKDDIVTRGQDTGWVDSVRFSATAPPPLVKVISENPDSGVAITVTPADRNGEANGATPFTREYESGAVARFSAPAQAGGNGFIDWYGCSTESGVACTATMTYDRTVTAVYAAGVSGLGDALDRPEWVFTAEEYDPWLSQTAVTHDGVDAAQAAPIGHYGYSWMQTTQAFTSAGYLSFFWRVSSEEGFDLLEFSIDGTPQASISGETEWEPKVFAVGAGTHVFRWTYRKDGSAVAGEDTAWVDDLRFGQEATMRTLTVSSSPSSGISVGVAPADGNGRAGGKTRFTRTYVEGTPVTVTAPVVQGSSYLSRWSGCSSTVRNSCTVTMGADRAVTAVYAPVVGLADALDWSSWSFTSPSPSPPWFGQKSVRHDGVDAARAGAVGAGEASTMQTVQYFNGSGYVSFWWKVSGGTLVFRIDGGYAGYASIGGETDWQEKSFYLLGGGRVHTLSWTYYRYSSTPRGADTGWVDSFKFTATAPQPVLTVASTGAPGGVVVGVSPKDVNGRSGGTTRFTRQYRAALPPATPTTVTLTAPPQAGANGFAGWSGCDSVAGTRCTIAMNSSHTVTAAYVPGASLGEAVDRPNWVFTTGGDAAWESQTATTYDGTDAARGGMIKNSQSAWMQTARTFTSPGTVSFWWKVSSERSYDYLKFFIDGVELAAISGETVWENKTFPVTAGTHVLRWNYGKDSSVTSGSDAGWVDRLAFDSDVVYPFAVAAEGPPAGVAVAVTPADRNLASNGTTPFSRSYGDMTDVTLTAPAMSDGWAFHSWTGCDSVAGTSCAVAVNGEESVTAVYRPATDLTATALEVALPDGDPRGLAPAPVRIVCGNAGPMPLDGAPVRFELYLRRQEDEATVALGVLEVPLTLGVGESVEVPLPDPADLLVPAWLGNGTWEPLVYLEPASAAVIDPDLENNLMAGAATALAGLPAQIFADDFTDGTGTGDIDWIVRAGRWKVDARKRYLATLRKSVSFVGRLDPWQSRPAAGVIEADVRIPPNVTGAAAGIVFGAQWPGYRIAKIARGSVALAQVGAYGGRAAGTIASKKAPLVPGVVYRLRLELEPDGDARVYVNGVLRLSGKVPQQVPGDVGLWAAQPGALFDAVSVSNEEALPPPTP